MATIDWTQRVQEDPEPVVRRMKVARAGVKKGELMLLPSARLVDDAIRAIPKGKSLTLLELRARLARQYRADGCCPVYLGYRLRTVAEATCEARDSGVRQSDLTPIWRVLDDRTPTTRKLAPSNADWLLARRAAERL